MHPRVEKLPKPTPDYHRFLQVLRREKSDRIPLIELAVHSDVVAALLDEPVENAEVVAANVRLMHRLGYDVLKISAPIPFDVQRLAGQDQSALSTGARAWQDQHAGAIGTLDDLERFHWPAKNEIDFTPVEQATRLLPDGMRLLGFSGGVLEFAMDLIGMERFMFATYDSPALIEGVVDRVGQIIYDVFANYCQMDSVCALWLGDDLGSKNGLLVSPDVLNTYIVPWYRRFVELAHQHDRPFLLHTCGKTDAIMPVLINEVGIDAKHSFEDAIEPVEQFIDTWSTKVATLGGVDVNLLSLGDEAAIRTRVQTILNHAAPHGGYALGSGNSIPNYVPPENYLTMIETAAEFNER
ncbi:MAG: uroporphyrinogen decarboxylase family protein [Planctomycetota bacterium]